MQCRFVGPLRGPFWVVGFVPTVPCPVGASSPPVTSKLDGFAALLGELGIAVCCPAGLCCCLHHRCWMASPPCWESWVLQAVAMRGCVAIYIIDVGRLRRPSAEYTLTQLYSPPCRFIYGIMQQMPNLRWLYLSLAFVAHSGIEPLFQE